MIVFHTVPAIISMCGCRWLSFRRCIGQSRDNMHVACKGVRCTPTRRIRPHNKGSQNFKRTSENPGQKFSELWTQLLRTSGQSSQKFPKMQILRVNMQFTPSGQTSENPRPKFSEVGTQLLRRPRGSISELGFEAPGPQHCILECPV